MLMRRIVLGLMVLIACGMLAAEEKGPDEPAARQADGTEVRITFPSANAHLPYVERCGLIGAVIRGETEIAVNGVPVSVYRTGAWATSVEVTEGTNVVEISGLRRFRDGAWHDEPWYTNHCFVVAAKPETKAVTNTAPVVIRQKEYPPLPYAGTAPGPFAPGRRPEQILVVLDPGHGGKDVGSISPHGFFEKDANLLLAKAVRRELEALGYRVAMTREGDSFPELYDRPKLAHARHADAFISIHHNAPALTRNPADVRYSSVYAWNPLGERLARALGDELGKATGGSPVCKGALRASYAVTRNPEIPSCLIEADFVTSPAGEEAIWNGERRRVLAQAIARGFAAWCAAEPELRKTVKNEP